MTAAPTTAPTRITAIDAEELRQRLVDDEQLTIIDVRTPGEFDSVHIRGSYNVPLPLLSEHTRELAERLEGHVVLICQSGNRAQQARGRLHDVGLAEATVLTGGIAEFEAAGGDVVHGARRWAMDRQVRMTAGSLVLLGVLGSRFVSPKFGFLAGAIGAGLAYSAASDSCAMASALSKMPWNRTAVDPTLENSIRAIPAAPQAL